MNNWKIKKLRDIAEINPKETLKKGSVCKKISMDKLIPYCRDIDDFELDAFNGGAKFRNGDTIMARITPCLENGKISQINCLNQDEVGFGSTEFIVFRAKEGVDKDFLYYLIISDLVKQPAIKSMVGSSGRQRVQNDVVADLDIKIPELSEQRRIGALLKVLDDKIHINGQINKNLEAQANSIFFNKCIAIKSIPLNWEKGNLTDIANFTNGLAMQKFRPKKNEIGIPVLKIAELRQGRCDKNSDLCSPSIDSNYIVHDGDVIFSWSGSLIVDFWTGGKCGLNQHLFNVNSSHFEKWFYYSWTKYYLNKFISIASDKATTMGHIKREDLTKAEVLIPSVNDYTSIGNEVSPLYELLISNRIQNRQLELLRDNLLPKIVTGQLDLSDLKIKL